MLQAGERITALSVAALAAVGATRLAVVRRPRVLVLSTGDEVLDQQPGQREPSAARVNNVNGPKTITSGFDLRA